MESDQKHFKFLTIPKFNVIIMTLKKSIVSNIKTKMKKVEMKNNILIKKCELLMELFRNKCKIKN